MELIFKIICCSAVFIGFYHFVLQGEKMFRFNRFYLLATLILSFTIPFMELGIRDFYTPDFKEFIPVVQENSIKEIPEILAVATVSIPTEMTVETPKTILAFSWIEILGTIGILISLMFLVRFFLNLWKINRLAIENEKVQKEGFTLVKINQKVSPFSFFHYLFASKQDVENEKIRSEIFYHELAHIKQKHSLDVIFVEFLLIFFWFNPFIYIYRKSILTNHEFLADEAVLNQHFDTKVYQHLLLEKIPVKSQTVLSSSFNYLVTKKRLIMMTKKTSKIKTAALKFFSIPLLVMVMLLFSEKVSAQIEPGKGVSKELFRQYKKQVRKATVKVKNEDGSKSKKVAVDNLDTELLSNIYNQMSDAQKLKVTPLPQSKNLTLNLDDVDVKLDLSDLDLLLSDLNLTKSDIDFDFSDLNLDLSDLGISIADLVLDVDSPEFKRQIEEIERKADEVEKYYDSPEFKKKIADIEKNAAEIEAKYNSPEFKKKIEDIERKAAEIEKYYDSPEFQNKIKDLEKKAKDMEGKAKEAEKAALEAEQEI